ncbi:MAG: hypothetical protein V3U67_07345 [Gemmatimonadota bacterium]
MAGKNPESELVQIGCTEAELDLMKRAAAEDGKMVEEWFRDQLVRIASTQHQVIA